MFDDHWLPKYPGFYDAALIPTKAEKQAGEKIGFDPAEYKRVTGAKTTLNEKGYDFFTQVGLRPSVQITGISSGFTGEGYRNAIPAKAVAKINFRLVKNQDPEKIMAGMEKFIKENLPDYASFELSAGDTHQGVKLDIDNKYIRDCAEKLKIAYGVEPIYRFVGGGLPIATDFSEILKIPVVSTPFANEDCNMHAVDENFLITDLQKALKFSTIFFKSASLGNAKS
jgi:acetylornithine deacetylase/succinyl-diaminopimelate desuccinylase-like protein